MNYSNPPTNPPENITHETFFSHILNHEIGCNIYIPSDYFEHDEMYPASYHIHGWQGNESSELWSIEKEYRNKQAITVFINAISSEDEYFDALLQIEAILITELIPHIDGRYRTNKSGDNRRLSGFSMGGAMAFYYAAKHPELFCAVTVYAGTFHHLYHKDSQTVGVKPEKAFELYSNMVKEKRDLEKNNILWLIRQQAEQIQGKLNIKIHIGTADVLFCDNEILHLYLESMSIPHEYRTFEGIGHELDNIV